MRRRGWVLMQVMILASLATIIAVASFHRTETQLVRARQGLDLEQAALMLDALEHLTPGQSARFALTVPGWDLVRATPVPGGWQLEARRTGQAVTVPTMTRDLK